MHKQIGEFHVSVTDPYPCWVRITTKHGELKFTHFELADLEYALAAAKQAILLALPERLRQEIP